MVGLPEKENVFLRSVPVRIFFVGARHAVPLQKNILQLANMLFGALWTEPGCRLAAAEAAVRRRGASATGTGGHDFRIRRRTNPTPAAAPDARKITAPGPVFVPVATGTRYCLWGC